MGAGNQAQVLCKDSLAHHRNKCVAESEAEHTPNSRMGGLGGEGTNAGPSSPGLDLTSALG